MIQLLQTMVFTQIWTNFWSNSSPEMNLLSPPTLLISNPSTAIIRLLKSTSKCLCTKK